MKILISSIAVFTSLVVVYFSVPGERFDRGPSASANSLPADLDVYLAESERQIPDIRPGAEKSIIWAGEPGTKTEFSVVYVHGFSASKEESRPVPDLIAEELGANLFFTRLTGHGRSGDAMADARAGDWWSDTLEAIQIGTRLGDKVILMGTSTGGTLSTIAAADQAIAADIHALVAVSPNYRYFAAPEVLLMRPFARHILPLLIGPERGFTPVNEQHAQWWTTRYPTSAVFPMAATVNEINRIDFQRMTVPALFMFSDTDSVADHSRTRLIAQTWGAPHEVITISPALGESPSGHNIIGDILAPSQTKLAVDAILDWIVTL